MSVTFASLIEADYPVFDLDDLAADPEGALVSRGLLSAPVTDEERYVGMAMLDTILSCDRKIPDREDARSAVGLEPVPAFGQSDQVFDNLDAVGRIRGEIIPVADENGLYIGVVRKGAVLSYLSTQFHAGEGSATIEIEVPPFGAKIHEIISALEKNDASVMSFGSRPADSGGEGQLLFFRVVVHDFFRLVRNLEKYGYLVRYHSPFPDGGYDEMREKALEFIRYIDM